MLYSRTSRKRPPKMSSAAGRLREVQTVNFWYFGKLVAEERWSQPQVRLYFITFQKAERAYNLQTHFYFNMLLFSLERSLVKSTIPIVT